MGSLRTGVLSGVLTLVLATAAGAETSMHSSSDHLVDLTSQHWCHDCVVKVIDKYGIMTGFLDHTFRGDWNVSRYELAAAVARTYNLIKLSRKIELPDIERRELGVDVNDDASKRLGPNHWAYQYVRKLAEENGLLGKLFDKGDFNGEQNLTREELAYGMVEFLEQMEKSMGRSLDPGRRETQLAVDLDPNSPYHKYVDLALNRYQFMNLHADHTFRSDRPVTRYELAAALCKIFDLFEMNGGQLAESN